MAPSSQELEPPANPGRFKALTELCSVIQDVTISMEEIIVGGGGESKGTQQLG
jgi:hypothetical protein